MTATDTTRQDDLPFLERMRGSTAAREGLFVLAAQGISVTASMAIDVLLFRSLPVAERGLLTAAIGLRAVLFYLSDLGLSLTTVRVGSEYAARGQQAEAAHIFRRMLGLRVMLAGIVFVAAYFLASTLARFPLAAAERTGLVWTAALAIVGMAAVGWGIDAAKSRRLFGSFFAQQTVEAAVRAVAVVVLFFVVGRAELSAENALLALSLAALVAGGFSIFAQRGALHAEQSLPEPTLAALDDKLRSFGRYAGASEILVAVSAQVEVFMLQTLRDSNDTAIFYGAQRLGLLLPLLAAALSAVLLPRAAALESAQACRSYIRKVLAVCVPLALASAAVLILAAEFIVPLLWGERYVSSVPALRWLAPAYALQLLLMPLTLVLFPLKHERTLVILNAINLALALGLGRWLIPLHGPLGAAWSALGTRAAMLVITAVTLTVVLKQSGDAQTNP